MGPIDEPARLGEIVLALQVAAPEIDDRREAMMLAPQLGEAGWGAGSFGGRQLTLDLGRAIERVDETCADAQVLFPYFWRKRSTRPAVSTSFCLPV